MCILFWAKDSDFFLEIYEVCQLFFAHARIIRVRAKKKPKYIEYVCSV